jgi:hypothetical protein
VIKTADSEIKGFSINLCLEKYAVKRHRQSIVGSSQSALHPLYKNTVKIACSNTDAAPAIGPKVKEIKILPEKSSQIGNDAYRAKTKRTIFKIDPIINIAVDRLFSRNSIHPITSFTYIILSIQYCLNCVNVLCKI